MKMDTTRRGFITAAALAAAAGAHRAATVAPTGGIGEAVSASYTLAPDDLYVRARILSPERPAVSAYQHPKVHVAWTQPYLCA